MAFWISLFSTIIFRKTMKILQGFEGNVPAHKYMKIKQPRKEGDYCSWRVWNFNQRSEKALHPQDVLNFIRGLLWLAWTHPASRHFRFSSILVCSMNFQKLWILPDTGKEAWKRWDIIHYLIAKWLLSRTPFSQIRKMCLKNRMY